MSEERALRGLFEEGLGVPFSDGNSIEPLRNGIEIFPAMLAAIREARHTIEFQTFVYWSGKPARDFADGLSERARAGVTVRVLLDAVGAHPMDRKLVEGMEAAGVETRWFREPVRWKIWQADNRSHRKILVVDRRTGFTGGVGIAEEWEGDARSRFEWRDTHFRLRGPVVRGLVGGFLANWLEAGPEDRLPPLADEPAPSDERPGAAAIQVARSAAAVGWSDIATVLRLLIGLARQRIRICTAYFVPGPMFTDALKDARSRGVEVEVMLPSLDVVDTRVSRLCSDAEIGPLLEAGVKFWSYRRSMLHNKVITVDGCLACVGSANFNQRSIHKDDELSVVVLDRNLTAALDRDFDDDLRGCETLDLARWKRRGPVRRLLQGLLRPVRQQT